MSRPILPRFLRRACLALALAAVPSATRGAVPPYADIKADIVVFGGTPAGIMAAVAAGRAGASVVLVEPSYLIGGLMSGGLHKTDIGKRETIGGLRASSSSASCGITRRPTARTPLR